MTGWSEDELNRIGGAEELQIASTRPDGSLRPFVTIWVVRVGGDLFVRSAYGSSNPWFVRARASGAGRIRAGGIERDVSFGAVGPDAPDAGVTAVHDDIDGAYHAKYDRHGPRIVGTVVGPGVRDTTIRLVPRTD